jgi:hypothetical protein
MTTKPDCVYKIRRKADGLYSGGKTNPIWTKRGKVWSSLSGLKSHLTLVGGRGGWVRAEDKASERQKNLRAVYAGCEIVTYIVTQTEKVREEIS